MRNRQSTWLHGFSIAHLPMIARILTLLPLSLMTAAEMSVHGQPSGKALSFSPSNESLNRHVTYCVAHRSPLDHSPHIDWLAPIVNDWRRNVRVRAAIGQRLGKFAESKSTPCSLHLARFSSPPPKKMSFLSELQVHLEMDIMLCKHCRAQIQSPGSGTCGLVSSHRAASS